MADQNLWANNGAVSQTVDPFQSDIQTLTVTVDLPIKLPPTTGGPLPGVHLRYSSAGAQAWVGEHHDTYEKAQGSVLGLGWQLDAGGVIDTADNTSFAYLTMGGATRTMVATGVAGTGVTVFQAQSEDFSKIRLYERQEGGVWQRYFKIWDREGTEYRFGGNEPRSDPAQAPVYNPHGSRQDLLTAYDGFPHPYPKRYYLDRVRDVHGNEVTFTYDVDFVDFDRELRVSGMLYGTNVVAGGSTVRRQVVFDYSASMARPDAVYLNAINVSYYETRYLTGIRVQVESAAGSGNWLTERSYDLTYESWNGDWSYTDQQGHTYIQVFPVLKTVTEKDANGSPVSDGAGNVVRTTFTYESKNGRFDGAPVPLMTRADNGCGGAVVWTYQAYAWRSNGGAANAVSQYQAVATRTRIDGMGGSAETTYTPSAPTGSPVAAWTTKWSPKDAGDVRAWPEFRGFTVVKVTEPGGFVQEHRFYRGLRNKDGLTVVRSDGTTLLPDYEELKGRPHEVRWFKDAPAYNAGAFLARERFTYATNVGDTYTVPSDPDKRDRSIYQVFLTERRRAQDADTIEMKTTHAYGAFGNETDTYEWADASNAHWTRHTKRWFYPKDYAPLVANQEQVCTYLVGKVAREEVYANSAVQSTDPDGDVLARATYTYYDGQGDWTAPPYDRGRATHLRQPIDAAGTRFADTDYVFDQWGHVTDTKRHAAEGTAGTWATGGERVAHVGYDPVYVFATLERNPLLQETAKTYYTSGGKFGLLHTVTDPNQQTTTLDYDAFGRLASVLGPNATGKDGTYRKELLLAYFGPTTTGGQTTTQIEVRRRTDAGGTAAYQFTRRFFDGTGQLVQEYRDAVGGHITVDRHYDARGLLSIESAPYLFAQNGAFNATQWAVGRTATAHTYDGLRRPLITTLPGGGTPGNPTVERTYYGFYTGLIDQNRHFRREKRDWLGRLVEVTEFKGQVAADLGNIGQLAVEGTTTYAYDVNDHLVGAVDQAGNATTIARDLLGRSVDETDPDLGHWQRRYDAVGNLTQTTDPRNKVVIRQYDLLDRLVSYWHLAEWTEGTITAGASRPTIFDLVELRSAVDANCAAAGQTRLVGGWLADPNTGLGPEEVRVGVTRVRAAHFNDIRTKIATLRTSLGMSASSAPTTPSDWPLDTTKHIRAEHPNDLRRWIAEYEADVATSGHPAWRARAFFGYDAQYWTSGTPNLVGRRTWCADGSGRSVWLYDPYGRVTLESRRIDGAVYDTSSTFDASDRLRELTLPDGEKLTHEYGGDLLLTRLSSSLGGPDIVSGATYNALGRATGWRQGPADAVQTYWGIDSTDTGASPYGALRSQRLGLNVAAPAVSANPPHLVDRILGWDAAGNLKALVDSTIGQPGTAALVENLTFGYDERDRLTSAHGDQAPTLDDTYAYAPNGNFTTRNGGAYGHGDAAHKHAVTSEPGGGTYAYDAAGNMSSRSSPAADFQHDPMNRLAKVSQGGQTVCRNAYDGDGKRTKRVDVNGTVHYAGGYERNVGTGAGLPEAVTKYYVAQLGPERKLVAFRKAGVLYLVGTDHLGGTIRVTDQSGAAVCPTLRYAVWGGLRSDASQVPMDHRFTGQVKDDVSGLYYFNARYRDPLLGRFCQPDTAEPAYANPQTLNRYAYTLNNPLKHTDPGGHFAILIRRRRSFSWAPAISAGIAALAGPAWRCTRSSRTATRCRATSPFLA